MESLQRHPWLTFPPVWIHSPEKTVKSHPHYTAGKAGDSDSAYQLVKDCLSLEVIHSIHASFKTRKPVIASAHAIERDGVNAIPEVLADLLGMHLGWQVDSSIVQSNIVAHTGADGFSRLARQARFEGSVESGEAYFLVDDFIGQGGTLANLRSFLISKGAHVIGASVLTGKPYSANLALSEETLKLLQTKHGPELEIWWRATFNFGYECLTESEARYLVNTPTIDRIRDRIAAAFQE